MDQGIIFRSEALKKFKFPQYWVIYSLLFTLMDFLTKILLEKYCVLQMIKLLYLVVTV